MHGVRDKILPPGEDLTDRAHLRGHMLDAVDDAAVLRTDNNIAVLPHDLDDQVLPAQISQFVQMLYRKMDDPLQLRLPYIHDAAAADMLSQEHTEIGRRDGARLIPGGEIDQGERRVRRDGEPFLSLRRLHRKEQLVCLGLCDLGDTPVF